MLGEYLKLGPPPQPKVCMSQRRLHTGACVFAIFMQSSEGSRTRPPRAMFRGKVVQSFRKSQPARLVQCSKRLGSRRWRQSRLSQSPGIPPNPHEHLFHDNANSPPFRYEAGGRPRFSANRREHASSIEAAASTETCRFEGRKIVRREDAQPGPPFERFSSLRTPHDPCKPENSHARCNPSDNRVRDTSGFLIPHTRARTPLVRCQWSVVRCQLRRSGGRRGDGAKRTHCSVVSGPFSLAGCRSQR